MGFATAKGRSVAFALELGYRTDTDKAAAIMLAEESLQTAVPSAWHRSKAKLKTLPDGDARPNRLWRRRL